MSLKDEILAKYAPPHRRVEALNGLAVYARALSGADWLELAALESNAERLVLTVVRGAVDAEGKRIFGDEDLEKVRALSREFTGPVSDAVLSLSGVGTDEGKGESTPGGSSPSA